MAPTDDVARIEIASDVIPPADLLHRLTSGKLGDEVRIEIHARGRTALRSDPTIVVAHVPGGFPALVSTIAGAAGATSRAGRRPTIEVDTRDGLTVSVPPDTPAERLPVLLEGLRAHYIRRVRLLDSG